MRLNCTQFNHRVQKKSAVVHSDSLSTSYQGRINIDKSKPNTNGLRPPLQRSPITPNPPPTDCEIQDPLLKKFETINLVRPFLTHGGCDTRDEEAQRIATISINIAEQLCMSVSDVRNQYFVLRAKPIHLESNNSFATKVGLHSIPQLSKDFQFCGDFAQKYGIPLKTAILQYRALWLRECRIYKNTIRNSSNAAQKVMKQWVQNPSIFNQEYPLEDQVYAELDNLPGRNERTEAQKIVRLCADIASNFEASTKQVVNAYINIHALEFDTKCTTEVIETLYTIACEQERSILKVITQYINIRKQQNKEFWPKPRPTRIKNAFNQIRGSNG